MLTESECGSNGAVRAGLQFTCKLRCVQDTPNHEWSVHIKCKSGPTLLLMALSGLGLGLGFNSAASYIACKVNPKCAMQAKTLQTENPRKRHI